MQQDIVLATLGKLKRQNEEITAQKQKINVLKAHKRQRKNTQFQETVQSYKKVSTEIEKLEDKEQQLLRKLRTIMDE